MNIKYKSVHPTLFANLTQGSDEVPPHAHGNISDVMFIKTHGQKTNFTQEKGYECNTISLGS